MRPRTYHSKGVVPNRQFPESSEISEVDDIASQCLNGISDERDGKLYTVRPTRSYLTRLFPRFSDPLRRLVRAAAAPPVSDAGGVNSDE